MLRWAVSTVTPAPLPLDEDGPAGDPVRPIRWPHAALPIVGLVALALSPVV